MRLPQTRTVIDLPEELRARIAAFQLAETQRRGKVVAQAAVLRRAVALGMDALEQQESLGEA